MFFNNKIRKSHIIRVCFVFKPSLSHLSSSSINLSIIYFLYTRRSLCKCVWTTHPSCIQVTQSSLPWLRWVVYQKKLRLRFLWYIYLLLTQELLTIGLNLIGKSNYQEYLHWSVCALYFLRKVKTQI